MSLESLGFDLPGSRKSLKLLSKTHLPWKNQIWPWASSNAASTGLGSPCQWREASTGYPGCNWPPRSLHTKPALKKKSSPRMVETASKEASQTSGGVSGLGGKEEPEERPHLSHRGQQELRVSLRQGLTSCLSTLPSLTSNGAISLVFIPSWGSTVGAWEVGASRGRPYRCWMPLRSSGLRLSG